MNIIRLVNVGVLTSFFTLGCSHNESPEVKKGEAAVSAPAPPSGSPTSPVGMDTKKRESGGMTIGSPPPKR